MIESHKVDIIFTENGPIISFPAKFEKGEYLTLDGDRALGTPERAVSRYTKLVKKPSDLGQIELQYVLFNLWETMRENESVKTKINSFVDNLFNFRSTRELDPEISRKFSLQPLTPDECFEKK